MRINNNLVAMNTHRMMTINGASQGKSMEKLSSGLRNMSVTYYFDENSTTGASVGTADSGASLSLRINLANVTDGSGAFDS